MRLTVGVIARDGMPFIEKCLGSLDALTGCAEEVEFILVDSASADGTQRAMLEFAATRPTVRVFALEGIVNAAVARNVVLRHAKAGAVFLVDGDVEVDREFVVSALRELSCHKCDIVCGQLPEIFHDHNNVPYATNPDRYRIDGRKYVRRFSGLVLLGPTVTKQGHLYDESFRRSQDLEFSMRLALKFKILALPIPMGKHYTVPYLHAARIKKYHREMYVRPAGRLLRNNIHRPVHLWHFRRTFSGHLVGFLFVSLFFLSAVSESAPLIVVTVSLILLDVARFVLNGRAQEWIPIRIIGMLHLMHGIVFPEVHEVRYTMVELTPISSSTLRRA